MDLKVTTTTRRLLERKLGAAKAVIFINGLKNIYRNAKYHGYYYDDTAMRDLLINSIARGR